MSPTLLGNRSHEEPKLDLVSAKKKSHCAFYLGTTMEVICDCYFYGITRTKLWFIISANVIGCKHFADQGSTDHPTCTQWTTKVKSHFMYKLPKEREKIKYQSHTQPVSHNKMRGFINTTPCLWSIIIFKGDFQRRSLQKTHQGQWLRPVFTYLSRKPCCETGISNADILSPRAKPLRS